MANRKDITFSEVALVAGSGTQIGRPIRTLGCDEVSVSLTVSVTAATLQATFTLAGTVDDARAQDYTAVLPAINNGTVSTLFTGITHSAGVVTFNNPAIGSYEIVVTYGGAAPKYLRPLWTFVSGGGAVSAQAVVAGWSS